MRVASILILIFIGGLSESRTSLSLGESARRRGALRRRGEVDEPLGWENGWGVAPGRHQEVPNLIREGSGEDERDREESEMRGSGDGLGVDDEDLLVETSTEGVIAPESSISPQAVESSREARQERVKKGEAKDWSEEYEYDSDNYFELDDGINDDTAAQTQLPKFITESQHVLVTEGSEIVLPCQVD